MRERLRETLVLRHTCVFKGRETRADEWVGKKNKASRKQETSDNIQRMKTYVSIGPQTMRVTCAAVSLDKLEKGHMDTLSHNMAAVFENTKTLFGLKQIKVCHVHETTLVFCIHSTPAKQTVLLNIHLRL